MYGEFFLFKFLLAQKFIFNLLKIEKNKYIQMDYLLLLN